MTKKIVVFDYGTDEGRLYHFASSNDELQELYSLEDIFKLPSVSVFAHLSDEDWSTICQDLPPDKFALRFSSRNSYLRSRPEGKYGNCFRCLKPTGGDEGLEEEELESLVRAFSDPQIVGNLCSAIPEKIRHLVSAYPIRRLRAVHIILQACMVEWGNTAAHGEQAIRLLGCRLQPSAIRPAVNRAGLFFRILTDRPWSKRADSDEMLKSVTVDLQNELGVCNLKEHPGLYDLLKYVCQAKMEEAPLPWETASGAFRELDWALRKVAHEK